MKRILCILLCTAMLLAMTGCFSDDPENPDQPLYPTEPSGAVTAPSEPEPTEPPVAGSPITAQELSGSYRAATEEGHHIQVCQWGDFFTIEHRVVDADGDWIWAEEFWPGEQGWPTEAGKPVTGEIQQFCMVTEGMLYDGKPMSCAIALTQTGITIERNGTMVEYVRDDTYAGNHTPTQELIAQLDEGIPGMTRGTLVGSWYYWDGRIFTFFEFNEDGRFFYLRKVAGEAPYICEGGWGLEDTFLVLWTEAVGAYSFPVQANLTWSYDMANDELVVYDDTGALLGESGASYTNPYSPDIEIIFPREDALGYVRNMYNAWLYTQSNGVIDSSYFFEVPEFLGSTDTICTLNEEIYYDFGILAENGISAFEAGEKPEWSTIYYEMYRTGSAITLVVHGSGDYNEFHKTYYYDTLTDTRLYPEDMLVLWGIDQEEYLATLRQMALEEFEIYHFEYSEEYLQELGAEEWLAWTLSADNLNLSRPVYMNNDGTLITYVQIESIDDCFWIGLYQWSEESDD